MKLWNGTEPELVQYVDHMGCDDSVCDAARVSMNKTSDLFTVHQNEKLLNYLAKHNHWSPFSHCHMKFRVKGPIFIARQLMKHQIGFSWNEVSRRYVSEEPEFWFPDHYRQAAENVKQGSRAESIHANELFKTDTMYVLQKASQHYHDLIQAGACAEQARSILPQSMMTEWIWTGSIYALARMYGLRSDAHAQREVQFYAYSIGDHVKKYFPLSWKALTDV